MAFNNHECIASNILMWNVYKYLFAVSGPITRFVLRIKYTRVPYPYWVASHVVKESRGSGMANAPDFKNPSLALTIYCTVMFLIFSFFLFIYFFNFVYHVYYFTCTCTCVTNSRSVLPLPFWIITILLLAKECCLILSIWATCLFQSM